ncbi:MAG TPA: BMP family protein [Gaiellaceae bacterium]|nr:BMP family protein [Gaiellaceae bacterium]
MRRKSLRLAAAAAALTAAVVAAAGASTSSGARESSAAAFKVAVLLPGSTSDQGYNADGQRSANLIKKALKADVTVTQSVSVPNQADVYRQYAAKGYNLVIGWGGQFTSGAVTVASEFPNVQFLVVNSNAKNGSNLSSFDTKIEDWEFLGGFVAAKLSKNGNVGWVGGQCFPATAANLHGFEQGARFASSRVKVQRTFTGDFEDPTKAQQAAQAMIDNGATALSGNLNNGWFGIFKAAKSNKNLPVVTEWTDNHKLAPTVIASSILKSQASFVLGLAKKAQAGTLGGKFYLFGLPKSWGPGISKTNLLPASVYRQALAVQKKIASGALKPKHDESCPK